MTEKKRGSRLKWITIVGLIALLVVAGLAWKFVKITPVYPEYNIVLITIDTTRADRLGCYGHESAQTPNIDTLANQGILYSRCYSPGPITLPSHTSLLTGLYPFRHGLRDNNAGRLSDDAVTLPEILKDNGYATVAAVGAYVLDSRFGLEQGFDVYDDDINRGNRDSRFHIAERKAEAVSASAIAWLDKIKDSKFFLWAHYFDPHANYAPPGVDLKKFANVPDKMRVLYDLEIAYTDKQIGRLLKRIGEIQESTGRPTLIVVTSDHGESLGDHGEPTHGMFVYNSTVHVPLLVFDSTETSRGIVIKKPVALVDVMPTIINRLGLEIPYEIDGRRLPDSPANTERRDSPIYFETMMTYNVHGWSPLEGIIQGDDKLIVAPEPEFFDLGNDPGENRNIYEEGAPRIEAMHSAYEDLKESRIESPALSVDEAPMDAQAIQKLISLGYVGNVVEPKEIPDNLPDPKKRISLHRELMSVESLAASGRNERAFEKLSWVILQDPGNTLCLRLIVNVMTIGEQKVAPEKVIELMQRLVKMRPESSECYYVLGKAHSEAGDIASALPEFDRAVQLDAENTDALNHYAWYCYKQGENLEIAHERAQQAVDLKPNDPHMRHTLACILLELDETNEAATQLEAALAIYPEFAVAHYHLGVARQCLGDNTKAIESLVRAIKLAAKLPPESAPDWLSDAEAKLEKLQPS